MQLRAQPFCQQIFIAHTQIRRVRQSSLHRNLRLLQHAIAEIMQNVRIAHFGLRLCNQIGAGKLVHRNDFVFRF